MCRRFGLNATTGSIILEYEVPKHCLRAHHRMSVDFESAGQSQDNAVADALQNVHGPWLTAVSPSQLAELVGRLRRLLATDKKAPPRQDVVKPRRQRASKLPSVARARSTSKEPEIKNVFDEIASGAENLTLDDLRSFACDYLGFGLIEIDDFFEKHSIDSLGAVPFEQFKTGYARFNPFMVSKRQGEVVIRKHGSLHGQQVNLEDLDDCEVYVCDPTAQVFADVCKRCLIFIAPCASSVFVRDCEDCVIWIATKQLRTRSCHRCTFYLYSKTEPVIELSTELIFAPWCAKYPKCAEHFKEAGFDPDCNLWNAVFDFTGKESQSNWSISDLGSVVELTLELDDAPESSSPPDNPVPEVTHARLVAKPIDSGESKGEGVANIPQKRPALPASPKAGTTIHRLSVRDGMKSPHSVGLGRLPARP